MPDVKAGNAKDRYRASDFKLGVKEKIGEHETQRLEYELSVKGNDVRAPCVVGRFISSPPLLRLLILIAVIHGLDDAEGFGVAAEADGECLAAFDGEANPGPDTLVWLPDRSVWPTRYSCYSPLTYSLLTLLSLIS